MKKVLSVLLTLSMLLSLSLPASAADTSSTHAVSADYSALITGLTVTGYSSVSKEGYLVVEEDDIIFFQLSGRNLDIGTEDNALVYGDELYLPMTAGYNRDTEAEGKYLKPNEDGSAATYSMSGTTLQMMFPTLLHMYYTNDGETLIDSGITLYITDTNKTAKITDMKITSGATYDETSGVYNIAYGSTEDVVIEVTGTNLSGYGATVTLPYGEEEISLENGWTYITDEYEQDTDSFFGYTVSVIKGATKSFAASTFYGCTSVFTAQYSTDGETYTDGVKILYESATIGVDISWGKLSFSYAAGAWTADGNTVTVATNDTNQANEIDITAAFTFSEGASDLGVTATWDATTATLDADKTSASFTLTLSEKPNKAFTGTIGTVTLTLKQGLGYDPDADAGVMPLE